MGCDLLLPLAAKLGLIQQQDIYGYHLEDLDVVMVQIHVVVACSVFDPLNRRLRGRM